MYPKINSICNELILQFDSISTERKQVLIAITEYIQQKKSEGLPIQLMYVCTHNSRRSHFGQIWAAVAAVYYGVLDVTTFSGGTEATAFNQNAIQALEEIGFQINSKDGGENPVYEVYFIDSTTPTHCRCVSSNSRSRNGRNTRPERIGIHHYVDVQVLFQLLIKSILNPEP